MLRRIAVIRVAQTLGPTLREISDALSELSTSHTPTKRDWERLSRRWRHNLDDRISQLQRLRDKLNGCIGCGCLSLRVCSLYNPDDHIAKTGTGARYLLDTPPEPKSFQA